MKRIVGKESWKVVGLQVSNERLVCVVKRNVGINALGLESAIGNVVGLGDDVVIIAGHLVQHIVTRSQKLIARRNDTKCVFAWLTKGRHVAKWKD